MNIDIFFKKQIEIIDCALDKYLPKPKTYPMVIHQAMRYAVFSGGKRIRPILAIEACRVCRGKISDVLIFACAIELIHAFSLVHDDLPSLDNDTTRRGRPTLHKKFGEAIAILAGDALLNFACGLVSKGKNYKKQNLINHELSQAIGTSGMVGGQVVDVFPSGKKTLGEINYINHHKTALLIAVCLKIGAITASAPKQQTKGLYDFGKDLGCIFQITDDLLDNDGLVRIIGQEKAKQQAQNVSDCAKQRLNIFGKRAERLREITDYVTNRKK
ncbi:MAG: polyprenyl synthetase family protein [Candidatus Omnitrophota bacterium]